MILRHVLLPTGTIADVVISDGCISAISAVGEHGTQGCEVLDLDGYLLLPSLVEPHAHLDKAFTADLVANPEGSLYGAIAAWLPARVAFHRRDIAARAWRIVFRYLAHGATTIRAHVDTGEDIGLKALEAILAVREALDGVVDLEIVAGCSVPVTGRSGASNRALVRDALAAGADLVGGAPAIDEAPSAAIDLLAATAAEFGVGLDLHTDETLDPKVATIDHLVEIAQAGFEQSITASHAVSLGVQSPSRQQRTAEALAASGIGVVVLPQTNLFLQGRGQGSHAPRGLTPVRRLLDAGVTVAAGGDNLQDPFNPMGRADPLETAALLAVAGHLPAGEAFAAVTSLGRRLLRRPAVAIEVGAPADLLAIRAATVREATAAAPSERVVLRAGRVVARTTVDTVTEPSADLDWSARW